MWQGKQSSIFMWHANNYQVPERFLGAASNMIIRRGRTRYDELTFSRKSKWFIVRVHGWNRKRATWDYERVDAIKLHEDLIEGLFTVRNEICICCLMLPPLPLPSRQVMTEDWHQSLLMLNANRRANRYSRSWLVLQWRSTSPFYTKKNWFFRRTITRKFPFKAWMCNIKCTHKFSIPCQCATIEKSAMKSL